MLAQPTVIRKMERLDPGSLPLWAQVFATLVPIIAAAYAMMRGYRGGANAPPAQTQNEAMMQLIGGSFSERHSNLAMIEALREIKDAIAGSTDELRRIRKSLDDHTEEMSKKLSRPTRRSP